MRTIELQHYTHQLGNTELKVTHTCEGCGAEIAEWEIHRAEWSNCLCVHCATLTPCELCGTLTTDNLCTKCKQL